MAARWEWQDGSGRWVPFSEALALRIEAASALNEKHVDVSEEHPGCFVDPRPHRWVMKNWETADQVTAHVRRVDAPEPHPRPAAVHTIVELDGDDEDEILRLTVDLPKISSVKEVNLDLSSRYIVVTSDLYAPLHVDLEKEVNPLGAKAKFVKKTKQLRVDLPVKAPAATPAGPSEEDKAAAQTAKADGNDKLRAGDLDGALEAYSKAIELDPTCAIFYANRAAVYTKMAGTENLEMAVADCQESVALDPSYIKGYLRLGLAYCCLENYEEAVNAGYSKAVELDPSNASAKQRLETAMQKLAAKREAVERRQRELHSQLVSKFMQERFADEATAHRCLEQAG